MRSILFRLLALVVVLAMLLAPLSTKPALAVTGPTTDEPSTESSPASPVTTKGVTGGLSETGLYIVQLSDPSLASYKGGVPGFEATSIEVTGARKLNVKSPASLAYLGYLQARQSDFIARMETSLGRSVEVKYQYMAALNGLAVRVSQQEAASLAGLPGVKEVFADTVRELDTDTGPLWIGANDIWNGNIGSGISTQGEGIVVGVIDTGINHANSSFADIGGDGYDHTNPLGSGVYLGDCNSIPGFCNDKLIGAYNFSSAPSVEDDHGHGSHTSSTAAGNRHVITVSDGITVTIQGVAPHANIIAYRGLNTAGSGNTSGLVACVNQAITDNIVDVLNYSISGSDDPWNDPIDLAFLDASNAGIFVSASAGNAGPNPGTVAKTGPWNASVAMSTIPRLYANSLDVTVPVTSTLQGLAALQGNGPAITTDIVREIAYDPTNLFGCSAFPPGYFTNKIGLVQRGNCYFSDKVANVAAASASAMVVFNNRGGPPTAMAVGGAIPSVMIGLEDGLNLVAEIDASAPVTARINAEISRIYNLAFADLIDSGSSRGPSQHELLKPDYAAPGVNILAAVAASGGNPEQYAFYSGTSMAAPHGAGSAALLIALHPDWSPAEVKSALATTTFPWQQMRATTATSVIPANPFDTGSGRLQVGVAANAGFVQNETYDNYVAANPDTGGDPKTLNQPSLVNYSCVGACVWTRTLTSVLGFSATYTPIFTSTPPTMTVTVEPASFTLPAGGTQVVTITANVTGLPMNAYAFGDVIFETDATFPGGMDVADQHLTIAVLPALSNVPALATIKTDKKSGSQLLSGLLVGEEITDLTVLVDGMNQAALYKPYVAEDPTPSLPYNGDGGTFVTTVNVPAGALRLVAQVMESTSLDVDMYVGTGTTPSSGTVVCTSATGAVLEYCNLDNPAAGTYWVLVQNFTGSGAPTDLIATAVGTVLPGDAGNLTVTGPTTVLPGVPFDLSMNWSIPALVDGDVYYGVFTVGADPANPGNLGRVAVNFSYSQPIFLSKLGPATAQTGDVIQYNMVMQGVGPIDGAGWLTDTLPVGIEFAGGLTATFGTATYNEGANSVYWNNVMPLVAYAPDRSARQPDGLPPTVKDTNLTPASGSEKQVSQPSSSINSASLLAQGFEEGLMPPTGWSVINSAASRHWQLVDIINNNPAWIHSGTYAGWVNYVAENQDEWLISPLLDLTNVQNAMSEFWVYANNNWVSYAELQFLVIDGGGTFTHTLWVQSSETWPYPSTYHQLQIDLSAYEGSSVYLAWRYVGNDGDSLALDDILVTGDVVAVPQTITVTFNVTVTAESGTVTNVANLSYNGDPFSADSVLTVAAPPVVQFTSNTPVTLGETAMFTPTVGGTGPFTYLWNFGDTITSTLVSPTHVYEAIGVYTVTLTATNVFGSGTITHLFEVKGIPPAVTFISNSPVTLGEAAVFTPTVTGTGPFEYLWNFGDNITSTLPSPTHLYEATGVYTVSVEVTSDWGTDTYSAQFEVVGVPPQVTFVSNSPVMLGEAAVFTPTVTGTGPFTYLWTFGDGITSTESSPSHVYAVADTYTVTVEVTSEWGTATYSAEFVVNAVPLKSVYLPIVWK